MPAVASPLPRQKENNELSLDIVDLERFVDDLREERNDKDFISDDEALALEETLALGNNSKALAELLESASFSEETDIVVGRGPWQLAVGVVVLGYRVQFGGVCRLRGLTGLPGMASAFQRRQVPPTNQFFEH